MAIQESHINNSQYTHTFHQNLYRYYSFLNNNNSHDGTLLLTHQRHKKKAVHQILIPGRLQLCTIHIGGCLLNIFNVYNYSGNRNEEEEDELLQKLSELISNLQHQPVIVIGDLNFNSRGSSYKDTKWLTFMEQHNLKEKETNIPSYIRRYSSKNKIQETNSRPDHLFHSSHVEIEYEQALPLVTTNDHIPIMFKFKLLVPTTWKRIINDELNIAKKLEEILKSLPVDNNKLRQLNHEIKNQSYKPRPITGFKESETITKLKQQLHNLHEQKLSEPEENKSNIEKALKETKKKLKEQHNLEFAEYRKKFIDSINHKHTKGIHNFDQHLKYHEIDWNSTQITKEGAVKYFKNKFTSKLNENTQVKFKPGISTVKEGPTNISITKEDVTDALKRMKSTTQGVDFTTKQIFEKIDPNTLASAFNHMIQTQDIPKCWKQGWIKLIGKKDLITDYKDLRPITIMNIGYRLLFNIITFKLKDWAESNINIRQQAFTRNRETTNHCVLIQALINKFRKKGFILTNIDIAAAYDSIELKIIDMALTHCKFPEELKNFILNAYSNHQIQIEWNHTLSEKFIKTRGIPQGCPLAPLIYNCISQMIIDKIIEREKLSIIPQDLDIDDIATLCFADDMSIINSNIALHNKRLKKINRWFKQIFLDINPAKSATTSLPKLHEALIDNTRIPNQNNQRILGGYLFESKLFKEELEKRKHKIMNILNILPINQIQPYNLKQVVTSKTLSLITHLARSNSISQHQIQSFDSAIRNKIKRKLNIDARTPKECLYLPIYQGGMGIPCLEMMTDIITLKSLINFSCHNYQLMQEAVNEAITSTSKTKKSKNLNIFENFHYIAKKYDLKVDNCNYIPQPINEETLQYHKQCKKFEVWTDGSKTEQGTGFGIILQSKNITTRHKFKLDPIHSNNTAELLSIVYTLKLLPTRAKAHIYTDSEISINILSNPRYRGPYLPLKIEFEHLKKSKNLQINVSKVKGHQNTGNIHVDKLAKKGCTLGKLIIPHRQLTQNQIILKSNNHWIPDVATFIKNKQLQKWNESIVLKTKNKFNPSCIFPTTFNFMKSKNISPQQKYAIWRNMHNAHMKTFKQTHLCPECNCVGTIEHYTTRCILLSEQRMYAKQQMKELVNIELIPHDRNEHLTSSKLLINSRGIIYYSDTYFTRRKQDIIKHWVDIQAILSLLIGRAFNQYWENERPEAPKGQ
ncbi:hypothetical protein C9374_012017 [Naegleria lovaniensis]|uniref:Reverse transcriptase domain-containing protein n=1 Tax=Naegleria lovaniensis TaxID=51637 RepID=A0AA88GDJ7_NAELO|nr:uncharacterized protein C9374_012017 [Naegleria lovaniensis]KAG2373554.1 hypothetical protein C9374_012017 [Naegleria lovaniensis]